MLGMKNKLVTATLTLLLLATPLFAQERKPQDEKAANIDRLLKILGAEKLQETMLDQLLPALKPLFSGNGQNDETSRKMLARLGELMTEEIHKADFSSINRELYDKYFTNDEIKGLIEFYESPVGKKAIEVLPAITQEAMQRGMQVGNTVGLKAMSRLIEEFPELKSVLQRPAQN